MKMRFIFFLFLSSICFVFSYLPIVQSETLNDSPRAAILLQNKGTTLWLIGIAVASDPKSNAAVIEDQQDHSQQLYHEGDRVDHVLIKRILPDWIVIDAGQGEEIIKLKGSLATGAEQEVLAEPATKQIRAIDSKGLRQKKFVLAREVVESELSNIDQTLDSLDISTGRMLNRQMGFRINSFEPDSLFTQMGFRNGDLVLSVNDHEIADSGQAKFFFQKIRDGGRLDVKIRRRARTYHIHLAIE